jgi:transmembrane sensor
MKAHESDPHRAATAPEWMAELGSVEFGPAQKAALADWLRESPRNVRDFLELTLLDQDLREVPVSAQQVNDWVAEVREMKPTPIAAMRDTSPALDMIERHDRTPARSRLRAWGMAASVALVVAMGAAYLHWQDGRYATGLGEQRILTLADGSVVTLNTSSTLKVDFSEHRRDIKLLEGEAFFRVAHDAARPFDVTARDATVRAVGTQFNVRVAPHTTLVSVVDGVVDVRERLASERAVQAATPEHPLRLHKGEEARVEARREVAPRQPSAIVKTAHAAPLRAVAWTRGRVEFEGMPLIDVLGEFQRYREFEVSVAEPLRQMRLTGSFDAQDPESALAYIATLPGVVVETTAVNSFLIRQQ